MRRLLFLASMGLLLGCSGPYLPEANQGNTELTVSIRSLTEQIPFNQRFGVEVQVSGLSTQPGASLAIYPVGAITVDTEKTSLIPAANGRATFQTCATVYKGGYSELVAEVMQEARSQTDTLDILFDGPGVHALALEAGATAVVGRVVDPLVRFRNVASTRETDFHLRYEGDKSMQTLTGNKLPSAVLLEKHRYARADQSLTEEQSSFNWMLPQISSGEPLPGELKAGSPTMGQARPQGLGCSANWVNKTAIIRYRIDRQLVPAANGTLVHIFDNNGRAGLLYLGSAYVGNGGALEFGVPTCDTSSWFNFSPPDLVFRLMTQDHSGLSLHQWAPWGMVVYSLQSGTFWNGFSAGQTVSYDSDDPGILNTLRVWHFAQKSHEFDRHSFGWLYAFGGGFPLHIWFPAWDYLRLVYNSRAAFAEAHIIWEHATSTGTIYQEIGHEAYYRRMLGFANYLFFYQQFSQNNSGYFPLCWACRNHEVWQESGPDAGMLEGWADFFEAITMKSLLGDRRMLDYLETAPPKAPKGQSVEGRVAAYLLDWWDLPSDYAIGQDDDAVQLEGFSPHSRYNAVGQLFQNANVLTSFSTLWSEKIKPSISETSSVTLAEHCVLLSSNTLSDSDLTCP